MVGWSFGGQAAKCQLEVRFQLEDSKYGPLLQALTCFLALGPKRLHKHKDPTKQYIGDSPCIGPLNQNVTSLCLCGLLGLYAWVGFKVWALTLRWYILGIKGFQTGGPYQRPMVWSVPARLHL